MKFVPLLSHKVVVGGVVGAFTCLWLGAYTLHLLPNDHWADFAAFMTWMLLCMASVVVALFGAIEHEAINDWAKEHLDD